ncbi:prenyltransferase-like protein [Gregarina niphandrodes]|uniref:Prenyltransferase-like protein n=1 Tax=Gregarina niphandrodes TaxID=110365 RepID=A0A023AZ79_GRENI|nr:prenyltransferase-like protein [Gregarina niphandrodes]EZG43932.1 prenyltransferase-like protein [Gregarina niphandrodes]|eukprot:XP_011132903.1 prenyltransferase-like protein [Gregarina niphandrodes]
MNEIPSESKVEVCLLRNKILAMLEEKHDEECVLYKSEHVQFCKYPFVKELPHKLIKLHAGQTWVLYWCLHAMKLLEHQVEGDIIATAREWLAAIECEGGGFGGGAGQIAHAGLTYAAVCSAVYCNFQPHRDSLASWLRSLFTPDGAVLMHRDGEADSRSVYCAVASCHMQAVLSSDLISAVVPFLVDCQRPDGGFAAEPGAESHAGYTWCALAALAICDKLELVDSLKALEWCLNRQSVLEGGCDGRPNKLVDACYSFFVCASIVIAGYALGIRPNFSHGGLKRYLLKCCQPCYLAWLGYDKPMKSIKGGGLCDKPGTTADWYHTSYGLSGLSITSDDLAQTSPILNVCIEDWLRQREMLSKCDAQFGPGEEKFHRWYNPFSGTGDVGNEGAPAFERAP